MPEKTPQDRKKKDEDYSFTFGGKSYTLPDPSRLGLSVPGKYTKAVVLNPNDEQAQMALAFALLEAADLPDKTREVIDNLTTQRMLEVLGEWMGESQGSSD